MPSKKVLPSVSTPTEVDERPATALVRVEDSMEDFLAVRMPGVAGAKMDVKYLFANRVGGSYFRCNYFKYDNGDLLVTRKMVDSRYVRVDKKNGHMTLTDLTIKNIRKI